MGLVLTKDLRVLVLVLRVYPRLHVNVNVSCMYVVAFTLIDYSVVHFSSCPYELID